MYEPIFPTQLWAHQNRNWTHSFLNAKCSRSPDSQQGSLWTCWMHEKPLYSRRSSYRLKNNFMDLSHLSLQGILPWGGRKEGNCLPLQIEKRQLREQHSKYAVPALGWNPGLGVPRHAAYGTPKKKCAASHEWADRQVLTGVTGCAAQDAEGSFQEEKLT